MAPEAVFSGPQDKLVPLTAQNDIESYLVTFERKMEAYTILKEQWTNNLSPQLTGNAQQAFTALVLKESKVYEGIKVTVVLRYCINKEVYRRQFRETSRKDVGMNRELAVRLLDLQTKWIKKCTSIEEVKEHVVLEQFLNTVSVEK